MHHPKGTSEHPLTPLKMTSDTTLFLENKQKRIRRRAIVDESRLPGRLQAADAGRDRPGSFSVDHLSEGKKRGPHPEPRHHLPSIPLNTTFHELVRRESMSYHSDPKQAKSVRVVFPTLFYNLFIPKQVTAIVSTMSIVEEQMSDIEKLWRKLDPSKERTPVMIYNTVGTRLGRNASGSPLTIEWMHETCRTHSVDCQFQEHFDSAFEDVTLEMVYEHCYTHRHTDAKVVYLHSKGSYHESHQNMHWRRALLQAVLHHECLISRPDQCNVCGLQFWPVWNAFFPGNFFAADCAYVSKLMHPIEFNRKQERLVLERENRGFETTLYGATAFALGLSRYMPEAWIGSHPHLLPCDMSTELDMQYWMRFHEQIDLEWSIAPRFPLETSHWPQMDHQRLRRIMESREERKHEYFLLLGRLYQWSQLYPDILPLDDSWVWLFFPDGIEWKDYFYRLQSSAKDFSLPWEGD
jgi:hypothetical protein